MFSRMFKPSSLSSLQAKARNFSTTNQVILISSYLIRNSKVMDMYNWNNYMSFCYYLLQNNVKVAVLGASGGIGQPLSLLLKQSPLVTQLNMYDIVKHTPGVAKDVSHIETASTVNAFVGPDQLADCVKGVDVSTYVS